MDDFFKLRAAQVHANYAAIQSAVDIMDNVYNELRAMIRGPFQLPAGNEAPHAVDSSMPT
jgi:hypothetical protein